MKKRTLMTLGAIALATAAHADLLIDNFGTGQWSLSMGGFDTYATHTATGLNTQDTLFGMRTTSVSVNQNFFNLPIVIESGNGNFAVAAQGLSTDYTMRSRYDADGQGVDMSEGDKIKIDMTVSTTGGALVKVGAIDSANRQKTGSATLAQSGFVLISKGQFGTFDWGHVKTFLVETESGNGTPRTMTFENIALVPEPASLIGFGALALFASRRSRRPRQGAGLPH
ncbi:MAG: PEP-CTERM sorting domain-containing protein [Armatimonadetes bacterium]|nr:PEP-CTERM sorting domain-containing protein [Armatimonadota bacterium]